MTTTEPTHRPVPTRRRLLRHPLLTRWRSEFPYHWDADDQVSRRELLRFTVMTSGTLFVATAGLAILSYLKPPVSVQRQAIAQVSDIPVGGVHYFNYPEADSQAILLHPSEGQFVAFSGKCTHLSCAVFYDEEQKHLACPCHDGVFDPNTGNPIAGPPQRALPRILLQQDGTTIYATKEIPQ